MLCPKCHTNNPDGEKYCRNCGFQLNASRICPECGAQNKHDTKFCRECGASLSPVSSFRRDVIENQNDSFFNKYKSLIIAAIILVLAIGAVTGIALYNNASSNTGRSDDGFSFFPLDNNTNQDIQVDDNDTNESVNATNKTVNDTDKNKTSDKNKDNSTDKNKTDAKKKISDSTNASSINETNKSVESVDNHSKGNGSNDDNDKNTSSDIKSDKSSKISSDSKSDKSSMLPFSKSEESSKKTSPDSKSDESLAEDGQNSSNESTDDNNVDVDDEVQEKFSDDNQSDDESNEIDMDDIPELAHEVQSAGYSFSTIEFDGKNISHSQCIAIFAKYISASKSGSIEIPQVGSSSSPSGEDLSQSVSKKDYMAVAKDVNSYIRANGKVPDNAVLPGGEESDISPNKILELLTKAIAENFPESVEI